MHFADYTNTQYSLNQEPRTYFRRLYFIGCSNTAPFVKSQHLQPTEINTCFFLLGPLLMSPVTGLAWSAGGVQYSVHKRNVSPVTKETRRVCTRNISTEKVYEKSALTIHAYQLCRSSFMVVTSSFLLTYCKIVYILKNPGSLECFLATSSVHPVLAFSSPSTRPIHGSPLPSLVIHFASPSQMQSFSLMLIIITH